MNPSLAIEAHGLTKRFGDFVAVDGIDLEVRAGELFGLLGPNGAGKTTMLSMLSCLTAPSSGTARVAGHDLATDAVGVKHAIGLVPQDLALYPTLSAKDNLIYFGSLYGFGGKDLARRVRQALEMVRLADHAGQTVSTLSGGMKRRINIAAGLLHAHVGCVLHRRAQHQDAACGIPRADPRRDVLRDRGQPACRVDRGAEEGIRGATRRQPSNSCGRCSTVEAPSAPEIPP